MAPPPLPRPAFLLFLLFLLPSLSFSAPIISVSPKILSKSGDTLQIQWSGVDSPSDLDWLGIYSPPDSPDKYFVGYLFLNSSPSWASGSGSLSLPLVNLRSPYQFRLFRWTRDEIDPKHHDHDNNPLPGTRRRLAISDAVSFEAINGPEQVHLSFTDREDEMRVLFVTGDGKEAFVEYGMEEGSLDKRVGTVVRRYERKHMCDWPANSTIGWRDPGFTHDGIMKYLKKGSRYYYKVGSDAGGWSPIHSFVSRNNDANETVAFLFGDMGTYVPYATFRRTQEESKSTVNWILRDIKDLGDTPALVSHIGDISYARGYSWLWDQFFNQIEPIASRIPYHVSIGNHEYDWPQQPWKPAWSYSSYGKDGGGECGVPYSLRFSMPGNSSVPTGTGAPHTGNLYYSFDAGLVHFLYISTETDFLEGSDQYQFIKNDLKSVNRERTPYVVVQGHRPMYTTSNELRDTALREKLRQNLEPLLVENKVTLALWGHVHRYERFCPLNNFDCVCDSSVSNLEGATVHVVIGMAGQDWQPIWEPRPDHTDVPIFPQPQRSMYRGGEFGYTRLVATKEKLTLTYIGNHDGSAHDVVEILSDGGSKVHIKDSENGTVSSKELKVDQGQDIHVSSVSLYTYAKSVGALILGAFGGFALSFILRSRANSRDTWVPVKSEEI